MPTIAAANSSLLILVMISVVAECTLLSKVQILLRIYNLEAESKPEHFRANMNHFYGTKNRFPGRRGAFASDKRRNAALWTDLTHRRPVVFLPVDIVARLCPFLYIAMRRALCHGAKHPGQMVHICPEML